MNVEVSLPLAFLAGVVSFLSPCILPVVPSYLAFVSGLTLEELREGSAPRARSTAVTHALLFVLGFSAVFMTLGLTATAFGSAFARVLPWLDRVGGAVIILLGLALLGWTPWRALRSEARVQLASRPAGALGSVVVGVAFGAGWTPCIGPVLGSILLYASLERTMGEGLLLLGTYALGLGVPFVAAAAALDRFLAGTARVRRWGVQLQRLAGTVLVLIGFLMVTGRFKTLTAALAGMGQLINLETP